MLRSSIGIVALLVAAALVATGSLWSVNVSEGPSITTIQQVAWQSRWATTVEGKHPVATVAARAPPSPPATGQAPEARRAVEVALTQLIPAKGDGRRGGFDDQRNVKRESDTVRRMLRQDGLSEWRPDPSLLPSQLPPGATMAELLNAVPVNGTAWLAFGNAGVTEMLTNWVCGGFELHETHLAPRARDSCVAR